MLLLLPIILFSNEKVTLQLQWKHQFEFAGFYMAKEKGFYNDVGLDVTLKEFDKNVNLINDVVSGKVEYGISYSNVISSYLNGKPVVFIANILKYSPLALATSRDIITPSDLNGKKIMGLDKSLSNTPLLSMMEQFHVDISQIKSVAPSFNVQDLITGQVDAMVVFTTNEVYKLDKSGFKYNLLKPSTYGVEFYDLNIFTSQAEVINHSQRVYNFKMASLKGWKYAVEHTDETIELILKKYNTQHKSKEHLLFEAIGIKNTILTNVFKLGSIDTKKVKLIAQSFKNIGLIKNTDFDFEKFIFDYKNRENFIVQQETFLKKLLNDFEEKIDVVLLKNIAIVIAFMIGMFLYRRYNLEKEIKLAVADSKKKDTLIFQQSKLVSMGEMIANISHQWRQPLASLNGLLINLEHEYETKTLDKKSFTCYIDEAESLITFMNQTISDFSNFFSPSKQKNDFSIYELLKSSEKILSASLRNKNIELEINYSHSDIQLYSFKSELIQILLILVNNAKDAAIERNVKNAKINISFNVKAKKINICVEDNAGGIDTSLHDKILEPYFTTKNKSVGTGLGLYIANTIVTQSLQGQLSVEHLENGTRFSIKI